MPNTSPMPPMPPIDPEPAIATADNAVRLLDVLYAARQGANPGRFLSLPQVNPSFGISGGVDLTWRTETRGMSARVDARRGPVEVSCWAAEHDPDGETFHVPIVGPGDPALVIDRRLLARLGEFATDDVIDQGMVKDVRQMVQQVASEGLRASGWRADDSRGRLGDTRLIGPDDYMARPSLAASASPTLPALPIPTSPATHPLALSAPSFAARKAEMNAALPLIRRAWRHAKADGQFKAAGLGGVALLLGGLFKFLIANSDVIAEIVRDVLALLAAGGLAKGNLTGPMAAPINPAVLRAARDYLDGVPEED